MIQKDLSAENRAAVAELQANSIDDLHKNGHLLKARSLKAVFLLSRVITSSAADTGLKTDAQSVADLLVDRLTEDSAVLRAGVRVALDELVDADRKLMRVTGTAGGIEEFRLQTKESADWFAHLRNIEIGLRNDPSAYESKLREELSVCSTSLRACLLAPCWTVMRRARSVAAADNSSRSLDS